MVSDEVTEAFRIRIKTADVVPVVGRFAICINPGTAVPDDCPDSRPVRIDCKPLSRCRHHFALLSASMVLLWFIHPMLTGVRRQMLFVQPIKMIPYRFIHCSLIVFYRQHIVSFFRQNFIRYFSLTSHCIYRHDITANIQQIQQCQDCCDLIAFFLGYQFTQGDFTFGSMIVFSPHFVNLNAVALHGEPPRQEA